MIKAFYESRNKTKDTRACKLMEVEGVNTTPAAACRICGAHRDYIDGVYICRACGQTVFKEVITTR